MGLIDGSCSRVHRFPRCNYAAGFVPPNACPMARSHYTLPRNALRRTEFRLRSLRPESHSGKTGPPGLEQLGDRIQRRGARSRNTLERFNEHFAPCGFNRTTSIPVMEWRKRR